MKRTIKIFTIMFLVLLMSSLTANAEINKIHKFKIGRTLLGLDYDGYSHNYKFKPKHDGYITFSGYIYNIQVSKKPKKTKVGKYLYSQQNLANSKKRAIVPVFKGKTIYLCGYYAKPIKFTKVKIKKNYSPDKAIVINRKKTVKVLGDGHVNHLHWYRFALNKAQRLTYWTNAIGPYSIYIYNSNFEEIDMVEDKKAGGKYHSKKQLPKGNYFVRIGTSYENGIPYMYTFKWN